MFKSGCVKSKSKFIDRKSKSKSKKTGLESDSSPSPVLEYYISLRCSQSMCLWLLCWLSAAFHQVMPLLCYFTAVTSVMYYLGALQWLVRGAGGIIELMIGASKVESFVAAANIFFGPVRFQLQTLKSATQNVLSLSKEVLLMEIKRTEHNFMQISDLMY